MLTSYLIPFFSAVALVELTTMKTFWGLAINCSGHAALHTIQPVMRIEPTKEAALMFISSTSEILKAPSPSFSPVPALPCSWRSF